MKGAAYDPLKRALDVVLAAVGLALTAPFQAVVALLVRRNLGSPVLFRQQRPGKNEEIFELVKFRTMKHPHPAVELVTDEQRLTRLGRFLRSTSLDELPTLWNVLKGDMSLVGPRPLLPRYLEHMTARERLRQTVRPGVTGWAQVNGRNNVPWDKRLEMDVWYVETRSFRLDIRCMLLTLGRVLRRTDVNVVPVESMLDLDQERAH